MSSLGQATSENPGQETAGDWWQQQSLPGWDPSVPLFCSMLRGLSKAKTCCQGEGSSDSEYQQFWIFLLHKYNHNFLLMLGTRLKGLFHLAAGLQLPRSITYGFSSSVVQWGFMCLQLSHTLSSLPPSYSSLSASLVCPGTLQMSVCPPKV